MHRREQTAWRALADTLRPVPRMSTSSFAEKFRRLSEIEAPERPGAWSNAVFPALGPIMDSADDAIATGKRGWVMMKSAQGGGSEAAINILARLQSEYASPTLYMISKDDLAREFGRVRFGHLLDTCEPLRRKALRGKRSGESLTRKRFTDGKIVVMGGRSVLNLQSEPYRFVFLDEVDSLQDEVADHGDPLKLAEMRTNSFFGQTLILAFAHPSRKHRGAAKLYYESSDQRRGFVKCYHCQAQFWFQWGHVKVHSEKGMNHAQAERDARCYHYHCPHCGSEINDAERLSMLAGGIEYRSVLEPAIAAVKSWVGVHFSAFYQPNWTIRRICQQWVDALDSQAARMVFHNKILGEPYEDAVQETSTDDWRRTILLPGDPHSYRRGQLPAGVQFVTAGQDSHASHLTYSCWGWGLCADSSNHSYLCGWLLDWDDLAITKRPELDATDLAVLDQAVFKRAFASEDRRRVLPARLVGLDTGYCHVAILQYCRRWPGRAMPIKGGAYTSASAAPPWSIGSAASYLVDGQVYKDDSLKTAILNTYQLKTELFSMLKSRLDVADGQHGTRKLPRLRLPVDAGDDVLEQLSAEELRCLRRRRNGDDERAWVRRGDNHYLDTLVYAYACALQLDPFQQQFDFDAPQRKYGAVGKAW